MNLNFVLTLAVHAEFRKERIANFVKDSMGQVIIKGLTFPGHTWKESDHAIG